MIVRVEAAHGMTVEVQHDTSGMSPDGVDTLLRQVVKLYDQAMDVDLASGVIDRPGTFEVTTTLDEDEGV